MSGWQFQYPYLLWLLALLPLLALLRGRSGKPAALKYSAVALAKGLGAHTRMRPGRFLFALRLLVLAFIIVALARPRLGEGHSEQQTSGLDIMMAIDLSGSMAALDMAPKDMIKRSGWQFYATDEIIDHTRLAVVKDVVEEFIQGRESDRIGLVTFATSAFLVSPLTLNHDWLATNLDRLELGLVDPGGTAIGTAIGTSVNRLKDLEAKDRVLILLTDGENTAGDIQPIPAAEAAAAFNVRIYTIHVGKAGRVPVMMINDNGAPQRYSGGEIVVDVGNVGADPDTLRTIAQKTGGEFFQATDKESLRKIYEKIDQLEKTEVELKTYQTYIEYFHVPLLIALALLALEQLLAHTRLRQVP